MIEFSRSENEEDELEQILKDSKRMAMASQLCKIFSFTDMLEYTSQLMPDIQKRRTGPREQNIALVEKILDTLKLAQGHALGFQRQIIALVSAGEDALLEDRKKAGISYFLLQVITPCSLLVDEHLKLLEDFPKVLKQTKAFTGIKEQLQQKSKELNMLLY